MTGTAHIVHAARQELTAVENAARRLAHAEQAVAAAERAEEQVDVRIVRHGGPARCSVALIGQLMRAHERVFVATLEERRWRQRLAIALQDELNGAVNA